MTKAQLKKQILDLPVEERLEVVEAVWASFGDSLDLPVPEWQRKMLDERIALADAKPDSGTSWPEAKEQALKAL